MFLITRSVSVQRFINVYNFAMRRAPLFAVNVISAFYNSVSAHLSYTDATGPRSCSAKCPFSVCVWSSVYKALRVPPPSLAGVRDIGATVYGLVMMWRIEQAVTQSPTAAAAAAAAGLNTSRQRRRPIYHAGPARIPHTQWEGRDSIFLSTPAGFCCHLVGKTLIIVCMWCRFSMFC